MYWCKNIIFCCEYFIGLEWRPSHAYLISGIWGPVWGRWSISLDLNQEAHGSSFAGLRVLLSIISQICFWFPGFAFLIIQLIKCQMVRWSPARRWQIHISRRVSARTTFVLIKNSYFFIGISCEVTKSMFNITVHDVFK
jgi:hypothetical protein